MEVMLDFEKLLLLMSAAVLFVAAAQKIKIPYPIALVVGGSFLSFLPGLDFTYIEPNLLLTIVLPPILYYGAFWASFADFKKHAKEITSLALGLVVATTLVVAFIFKWCFPEFSWPLAFAFGAIVSPPDATCATAILKRFPLGNKLITILEGESLVNDASALVLYKIAVTALATGSFSLFEASWEFVYMALAGVAVGLSLNWAFQHLAARYLEPVVGALASFIIPYVIYITATAIDASAVLAVVASGIIGSRILFKHQTSLRRMIGRVTWDMYIIILNCFIFVLIGSQLDEQTSHLSWYQIAQLTGYSFLITVVMFFIRIFWSCIKSIVDYHRKQNTDKAHEISEIMREGVIIGWVGMRGIVSLTAALALPMTLDNGSPLLGRQEVIYMVFCIILFTIVIPTVTLPKLLALLNLPEHLPKDAANETRKTLVEVAREEINRLHSSQTVSEEERGVLYNYFTTRTKLLVLATKENSNHKQFEHARKKVVQAQRRVLLEKWEDGMIDDRVLAQIEHELDVEETQTTRAEL